MHWKSWDCAESDLDDPLSQDPAVARLRASKSHHGWYGCLLVPPPHHPENIKVECGSSCCQGKKCVWNPCALDPCAPCRATYSFLLSKSRLKRHQIDYCEDDTPICQSEGCQGPIVLDNSRPCFLMGPTYFHFWSVKLNNMAQGWNCYST